MPEIIDFSNKPNFNSVADFSAATQVNVGMVQTPHLGSLDESEYCNFILPELKLTRQHGRYFDCDENLGDRPAVL